MTETGKAISQLQATWVQTVHLFERNSFPSGEGPLEEKVEAGQRSSVSTGMGAAEGLQVGVPDSQRGGGPVEGVLQLLPQRKRPHLCPLSSEAEGTFRETH